MEAAVFVAADDVKGEGRSVPGCVFVRDHELEDAATDGLALLQETGFITSINHRSSASSEGVGLTSLKSLQFVAQLNFSALYGAITNILNSECF